MDPEGGVVGPLEVDGRGGIELLNSFGVEESADPVGADVEQEMAEGGIMHAHKFLVEVQLGWAELAALGEGDPVRFLDGRGWVVDQVGDLGILLDDEVGRGSVDGGLAGAWARCCVKSSEGFSVGEVGGQLIQHKKAGSLVAAVGFVERFPFLHGRGGPGLSAVLE